MEQGSDDDIGRAGLCHNILSSRKLLGLGGKSVTNFVPSCLLSL